MLLTCPAGRFGSEVNACHFAVGYNEPVTPRAFHYPSPWSFRSRSAPVARTHMIAMSDVAVVVQDAKLSARWWKEKVGFAVHTLGPPNGHAVMVAPPGDRFLLHLCEGVERVEGGNTGIGFVTDDLDGLVNRMTAAGVRFTEPVTRDQVGAATKFADPDGNIFWLFGLPTSFIRQEVDLRAA